jgi:putative aldouronate transport system permease protein
MKVFIKEKSMGNRIRMSVSDWIIYAVIGTISLVCVLPFLYVIMVSLTDPASYIPFQFYLIPKKWSLDAYRYIMATKSFRTAFGNSAFITIVGTFFNLIITLTFAYALSKSRLPGYRAFHTMVIITLFFNAGQIPTFLVVKNTGLLNSLWSLIIPTLTSAWDIVVVRSFFLSIPSTLEEAARIDGCSDLGVFSRVVLPLSMPVIATFTLLFAVRHWNVYFHALMYLTNTDKWTLQLVVKQMVIDSDTSGMALSLGSDTAPPQETLRMASVVVSMIPIMCVYPFLQKHFAKGVMIGSIKG